MDNMAAAGSAGSSDATAALPARKAKRFPWLEWFLVLAGEALFFQAVPSAWTSLIHALSWLRATLDPVVRLLDVRNWNLVGYIVALSIILVVLVLLKVWRDRSDWSAEMLRWSRTHKPRD
jgi:hypothetical protein